MHEEAKKFFQNILLLITNVILMKHYVEFSKEGFKGTLFNASEISTQEIDINYISVMHLNLVTFDLQIPI